jgi:hypothetical protein
MKAELEKQKAKWLIGSLVVIALFINSCFLGRKENLQPATVPSQSYYSPPQSQPVVEAKVPARNEAEDRAAAARRAAEVAAKERQDFLARYLTAGTYTRKDGVKTVAVVAVSETGRFNRALSTSISTRLKTNSVEILSSLFQPEFVSDGLFNRVCDGGNEIVRQLELRRFLDFLVCARQQVRYTSNPSLENVITANMQLDVLILPVAALAEPGTLTLTANGVGFKQNEARLMAEERLIKQLTKDGKMSLADLIPDLQNQ